MTSEQPSNGDDEEEGEEEEDEENGDDSTKRVMVQFTSVQGQPTGPQVEIPLDATSKQLTEMLNAIVENEEKVPYTFYHNQEEIVVDLKNTLEKQKQNTEGALSIVFQPQALFRYTHEWEYVSDC